MESPIEFTDGGHGRLLVLRYRGCNEEPRHHPGGRSPRPSRVGRPPDIVPTMSDYTEHDHPGDSVKPARRGQTFVEFALLLPMLIVLFLGIADFARVFQAGIVIEAAARNGAEVAALERLRSQPPPADPERMAYYQHLHDLAAQTTCAEARGLPNTTYVADDPGTPMPEDEVCSAWPVIAVCVHDGADPLCGDLAFGFSGSPPSECSEFSRAWDSTTPDDVVSYSVEVRTCYRFTTLVNLNFSLPLGWGLALGDIHLQKTRMFVVDCAPGALSGC